MTLAVPIQTTPAIQAKARELSLLLCESNVTQVTTQDERMRWFRHAHSDGAPWKAEYDALLKELKTITAIETYAEIYAESTPQNSHPGRNLPSASLERLDAGWLTVLPGSIVFLLSLASEDGSEAAIQSGASIEDSNAASVSKWPCGSGVLLLGGSWRAEPTPFDFLQIPLRRSLQKSKRVQPAVSSDGQ
ncbi:hypothetical protein PMIN03_011482 [Paraphaeosphaeria minitans]